MKERSVIQFNFKCPEALAELIDQDIEHTGEYRNRSEWVLAAVRQFIDYRTKIIAERKAAFSPPEDEDFVSAPSGSLQSWNDEVKE